MNFEREFLRLAAAMLRCRFQVMNGTGCCGKVPGVQYTGMPIDGIMCYIGYADHAAEMLLLCREATGGR
jgi:hypothetical protein